MQTRTSGNVIPDPFSAMAIGDYPSDLYHQTGQGLNYLPNRIRQNGHSSPAVAGRPDDAR
jgi:hypothetical protein